MMPQGADLEPSPSIPILDWSKSTEDDSTSLPLKSVGSSLPHTCHLCLDIFPISEGRNSEKVGEGKGKKQTIYRSPLYSFLCFLLSLVHPQLQSEQFFKSENKLMITKGKRGVVDKFRIWD